MSSTTLAQKKRLKLFDGAKPFSDKQNKVLNILFYSVLVGTFVSMLGIILYYIYAFAAKSLGNASFDWLLGIFSDFVYIMDVSLEASPYVAQDSSYPPLAIMILYPFALICKGVFAEYSHCYLTVDELTSRVVVHWEFWVSIVLFFALCSAAIILAVIKQYKLPPVQAFTVGIIIIMSAPFIYAVMRGNTIYFAMIFLLLFILLYQNEKAYVREIGYLCLVFAGLIKIYPLFFGVFLLHKKKIWASFRIAVYFFALFFLSFFLFEGGMYHLAPFIKNLGGFASSSDRLIAGNNLSLTAFVFRIFKPFGIPFSVIDVISTVITVLAFIVATVCAVYTKSDFSRFAIASAIVVLVPTVSYFYVLIFTLFPFMQFIRDYDELSPTRQKLYTVLFLVMFLAPLILLKNFILQSAAVIVMLAYECFCVGKYEIFKKK
jgi:hypothetical protein